MRSLGLIALVVAPLCLACGGPHEGDIARSAPKPATVVAAFEQQRSRALFEHPRVDGAQLVLAGPRVVADDVITLGKRGAQPTPSLAVDPQGTPHVAFTLADRNKPGLKQLDSVGYGVRVGGAWRLTPAVASGWRALIDISAAGAPQLWTFDEASNNAELRRLGPSGFAVVDRVDLAQVYQVLRRGGAVEAMLGDFGGNLYLLRPIASGWSKSWVKRWGSDVRPRGVLVPGAGAAIFERTLLNHIGSASTEPVPGPTPGYRRPGGPLLDRSGRMHVLQDTASSWQNHILLQTRSPGGSWSSKTAHKDAAPPPPSSCPTQLGLACTFTAVSHQPLGLVLVGDRPLPVLLRTTQQASYQRTCLQYDPKWPGSAPPCIDPGGPSGPWQATPSKGGVDRLELVVDGLAVTLSAPLTNPVSAAVDSDGSGRVHVALYQGAALRYIALSLR